MQDNVRDDYLLFYIKNRNQTTTSCRSWFAADHYFTSKIEIKPQPIVFCIIFTILFYIKNRNQTTTEDDADFSLFNYFTSKIEIKPQLVW